MKVESAFDVPVPREQAWELLMDVPRVVPCMPGAQLKEEVGKDQWKTEVTVKLGPINLTFDALVTREVADPAAGILRLLGDAREKRGRGSARAEIEARLTEVEKQTRMDIVTDLTLSGMVAQYGRGIVQDVTQELTDKFADGLRAQLVAGSQQELPAAHPVPAKPISGLSLGLTIIFRRMVGALFRPFRWISRR